MSVAGQRQKYYVRIQSIWTAQNLYTFFTLEPKNHFRADSDENFVLFYVKMITVTFQVNILIPKN